MTDETKARIDRKVDRLVKNYMIGANTYEDTTDTATAAAWVSRTIEIPEKDINEAITYMVNQLIVKCG